MGNDMQKDAYHVPVDCDIPPSLRPIFPFLNDAQRCMLNAQKASSPMEAKGRKKMAVSCINHGFRLLNVLSLEIDSQGFAVLDTFRNARNKICNELNIHIDPENEYRHGENKTPHASHEMLIAEADEVLALAEEQLQEGFKFDATLNYHTACVYYRVMESMLPSIAGHVHQRLMYAAWRTRQCSPLSHNFVGEHFEGESCSDVYQIHGGSKLGKGSYGSVYLASHRITGDERAVKVMNVDKVTSYYLRKLHTEISILKSVDHPNIIKLQDVFFGKRSVYLVTDLCRGGELFELLNSGKNQGFVFREDRASKLMRDMISAVHYLHSKGIVHRDLKLENFLFEAKSSSSPLVLIDFGLSKHFEHGERLTQRVGSCYYTAPEVLAGSYDYRCDIWSLGVLCFMLLSGSPPFFGKTVEDVYQATISQEPVFPEKKFRHVSGVCMDFMRKLLVKDPNMRMSTAQALAHPFITGGLGALYMHMPPAGGQQIMPPAHSHSDMLITQELADEIVENICAFMAADTLTKITLEMIAHSLSPESVQKLRSEFQLIDKSHSGTMTIQELIDGLMGSKLVATGILNLRNAYQAISIEKYHGHINELTYHEYIAAVMGKRVRIEPERVSLVFSRLDPDGQGFISTDSIRKVLGEDIPQHELELMIDAADLNKDRLVTHDEFMNLWFRQLQVTDSNQSSHIIQQKYFEEKDSAMEEG